MKVNFPFYKELPVCVGSEVQTRSEETGLIQHTTLEAAVRHAEQDQTVWKISYQTEDGWYRFCIR